MANEAKYLNIVKEHGSESDFEFEFGGERFTIRVNRVGKDALAAAQVAANAQAEHMASKAKPKTFGSKVP